MTEREMLIANAMNQDEKKLSDFQIGRLPNNPTKDDLRKFSKIRLKKKRAKKKFDKYWYRYISDEIYAEFMGKVMMPLMATPMNYQEIVRELISIEPLPDGGYAHLDKFRNKPTGDVKSNEV